MLVKETFNKNNIIKDKKSMDSTNMAKEEGKLMIFFYNSFTQKKQVK